MVLPWLYRSSAGLGLAMLRGIGDPFLDFFGFRELSRFHHCKIRFLPKSVRGTDRIGDTEISKLFIKKQKDVQTYL